MKVVHSIVSYDPNDVDGQERLKTEAANAKRLTLKNEEDDIKWLMGMRRGRAIVWRILDYAGVFRLSFNQNAMTMSFNEGNRNYGNRVFGQVNSLCPELYVKMQQEALNDRDSGSDTNPN